MSQRAKNAKKTPVEPLQPFVNYKTFGLARNFRLADIVTLCNSFCGCLSILTSLELVSSLKGAVIEREAFSDDQLKMIRIAFVLPFLGGLFDVLDGKVARWTKGGASMLGQELDSLSDLISFGVAPTVLAFVIGLQTVVDRIILAAFCCAGLARLARFNVTVHTIQQDENGKAKYFEGLPIPTSLCLVFVMY
jgi:CDP-diacylglycerol--serine O-phosphatidyltransferase